MLSDRIRSLGLADKFDILDTAISLREAYGDSRTSAGARFEQELAKLYSRTGWTQEKIAEKECKSKSQINRWILFGRFLWFSPTGGFFEKLPNNLTERRFRSYWERVPGWRPNFPAARK